MLGYKQFVYVCQLYESQGEEVCQWRVSGGHIGAANAPKEGVSLAQPHHYWQEHGRRGKRPATERLVRFGTEHDGYGGRSRRPYGSLFGQQRHKKQYETEKVPARDNRQKGAGYQNSSEGVVSICDT